MEKVAGIYEYYAEKAGEEFKESALSDATELEVRQWQENRKNLEKILAKVTVDELKRHIINAMGKGVKDLAVDRRLLKVKSLDELINFLKEYTDVLRDKRIVVEKSNEKLKSRLSVLKEQSKNEDKIGLEQEAEIKKISHAISRGSYYSAEVWKSLNVTEALIKDISKIRELTGASSSVVMRKKIGKIGWGKRKR